MEENTLYLAMLFDLYGALLTDKQREYFDLHYNADLSLAEIAEQTGISRQGVWDIIKRAEAILRDTEEKTGLAARFEARRESVRELEQTLAPLEEYEDEGVRRRVCAALMMLKALED